ncbi:MAG: hypothetical protein U9N77_16670, partial [Thermodesulfobacteriota bacterium]|nr:hypothetical protein [Thermodesulfobacteriota bacterium]
MKNSVPQFLKGYVISDSLLKIKNAWSQAFIIILLTAFILQAVNPCASICASMAEQGYRDIS